MVTTKKSSSKTSKGGVTKKALKAWVKEFVTVKRQVKTFSARQTELRDQISAVVEDTGYEDDKGHIWLDLDEPIEGVSQLKRERRVSQRLDEEQAEKILKRKKLYDDCVVMVPQFDEDAIMKAVWEKKITQKELERMFPQKISWAFITVE